MGAADVRLETESALDTMDFVNKIVNNGKDNLRIKANNVDNRMADKMDNLAFDFNFP